jgi:hypothetical protein
MKKILLISFLLFYQLSYSQNNHKKIINYLPKASELKDWEPAGKPEIYVGEDLFTFINGGADIYHEYGFNQVVYNEYKDNQDHSINVEIYEMKSSESAFGVYSFKSGGKGETVAVGNDGFLQSYYMNFWKDDFVITLTGFDEDKTTINGIKTIAEVIGKKIKTKGRRPHLVNLLPNKDMQVARPKYLKGILALFNQYNFSSKDIFGISEAVLGTYKDHQLYIFQYENEKESLQFFENVSNKMQTNPDFLNVISKDGFVSMQDKKGNHLSIKPFLNYILVFISDKKSSIERFDFVQKHIKKLSE